jgi:hypothetical protein
VDDGSQARQAASLVVRIATWLRDEEASAVFTLLSYQVVSAQCARRAGARGMIMSNTCPNGY